MKGAKLLTLIVAFSSGLLSAPGHAQGPGEVSDEHAIRELMAQTTAAFNNHDAKGWSRFCTPDARLVTVRGESMSGVAEIEKGLAAIFTTRGCRAALR